MSAAFLHDAARHLAPGCALSGLPAGAAAWALARAVAGRPEALPLLLVAPDREEAALLCRELEFHLDPKYAVLAYPMDDRRPYDGTSPHPSIPRRRLAALDALDRRRPCVVVAPAEALLPRVLPAAVLRAHRTEIRVSDTLDRDGLLRKLADWGYLVVGAVEEPGTVARRGGVLDLWPAGEDQPVRIELFDDFVEDIRRMDPDTQRSHGKQPLDRVVILPAREGILTPEALSRAAEVTQRGVDAQGGGQSTRRRALQELRDGLWFPGAEDYLPALHALIDPLDYAGSIAVLDAPAVASALRKAATDAVTRWEAASIDERAPVPPDSRFADPEVVIAGLAKAATLAAFAPDATDFGARDNRVLKVGANDLAPVAGTLRGWLDEGWRVALVGESRARAERMAALFAPHGLDPVPRPAGDLPPLGQLALWTGDLPRGFHAPHDRLAIVTADELFVTHARAHRAPKTLREAAVGSYNELRPGDLVVHSRHGIGRFEGLKRLPVQLTDPGLWGVERPPSDRVEQDFVVIAYRGDDRMYLPVTRLEQLSRYKAVGDGTPALDKLGGETWARRKAKVKDRVLAMAHELLRLHAMRAVATAHAYEGIPADYRQFEETFPYTETPDQEAAIHDVLEDLAKPEPMDRLLIGDVGFGKTEVAMRAAMRVILDGHQVAVLVPTTVLAFQHHETFLKRFEDIPVRIELLSRFRSAAEVRAVLEDTAAGKVDILIGTHAILGRSLRFRKLGLMVVDEEHRFGVRQKEKLKKIATDVHVLAMSATPIPRTLHMALSGLRKVSLITTPPADRLPVRTHVARWSDTLIRDEIMTELRRGGQVFFVHNRIETLGGVLSELSRLVPEARIGVAHGQMEAAALEKVLVDFVRRRTHILLCTAIIESGVDIPNANTLLVDRADQFGLAQLYQLRGRIGRSAVRGHCTLLVPRETAISRDAMRRLQVLQEHTDLGSGFAIANADLELRGSGNLLGESQHGQIQAVGLDTYVELLEEAVGEARGDFARQRIDPELEIPVSALLPESYIEDLEERLVEYRRLATARTVPQVRDLLDSWEDRYGEPPPEVLNLGWMAEARVRCRDLGIERVHWLKVRTVLAFHPSTKVPPERIVKLVQAEPARFALKGNDKLEVRFSPDEAAWPFRFLHWVFVRLEG